MVDGRNLGIRQQFLQCGEVVIARSLHSAPLRIGLYRDETRTEAVQARVVLVATVLVYLSLSPEWRLFRNDRQAVGLYRTVATTFADQVVDDDEPLRILELAALAPPALLGGAGLCVDQHSDTWYFAQLPLHGVELATV